jgi:class 3 adenylate cyclase
MVTLPTATIEAYATLARNDWRMWSRAFVEIGTSRRFPDAVGGISEMLLQSVTGDSAADQLIQGARDADVTADATTLVMPVLVAHGTDDLVVPQSFGYDLAALIPNVQFMSIPGGVSFFFLGDTAPLLAALDEFTSSPRGSPVSPEPTAIGLRTVIFTDLVGHTEMMRRLGDERGRAVLREHERITRETLKQHAGVEVKTMGDGFMASFPSVTKAMDCAIALQRAFTARDGERLQVRVGLNAGEPIEEDGDLFGSTVIMASRIAATAAAGEILIPEPLRHLLTGKSYVYSDRGETMLKGFEDAVRLYEVRWQA